jgi:hypothetical protein
MAINVFTELKQLLTDPKTNFFPTSSTLPQVGGSPLPLLALVNEDSISTPQLPLNISGVRNLVTSIGLDDLNTLNSNLLDAIKNGNPLNALKAIVEIPRELQVMAGQAETLLAHQLIIGASLFSIFATLDPTNQHNLLNSVYSAQAQYFFAGGYTTVAGQKISPPDLPSGSDLAGADPKTFFSQKTGERYVRDLTRVGFEAVANDTWKLLTRYEKIDTTGAIKNKDKAKTWFKGYSDYSEAGVTSAVEQALSQGGGPVQANLLLAAGVATAAGTAARKATQHVFLQEIGI